MTEHITLIEDHGLDLIGIGAEGGDMDEPVTVPERLRRLSGRATGAEWTWFDPVNDAGEHQPFVGLTADGVVVADIVTRNPADAALIVEAVNFVRSIPPGYVLVPGEAAADALDEIPNARSGRPPAPAGEPHA